MNAIDLGDPCWYRALTLTERLASLRGGRQATGEVAIDAAVAERRLRRWRDREPFATDGFFARRLAADGLDEADLLRLLGEPIEAVRDRVPGPPGWLVELDRAFSRPEAAPHPPSRDGGEHPLHGLLEVIAPLIDRGRDRMRRGIGAIGGRHGAPPFDPETVERAFCEALPDRLLAMIAGTMALELNVCRLRGDLRGETAADRFRCFVGRLREREYAMGLLREYPVLARQLVETVDRWAAFGLEFLEHLCADLEAIRETFHPEGDPGPVAGVTGSLGDSHGGGRSVLIVAFGSGLRVVYKPRSLAVDVHFQELLSWLNERGDHPPFRTLRVLDRGTHGWVEFVAQRACETPGEVRRFYRRQGGQLALLHALDATDFHFENLIAAGEHPVLIDLEALFHPREESGPAGPAGPLAEEAMTQSVLRVGLLPQRFWAGEQSEGVDISGLGAVEGQLTPQPVPFWEGAGTDVMQLERKRLAMSDGQHRPTLRGEAVSPLDHAGELEAGFSEIYRLLWEHREALLAPGGMLRQFAGDEIRVILRPTRTYATLLRESFHPDLLRDALDRDRYFDHLWSDAPNRPGPLAAFPAERDDLLRGDIPAGRSRPESRDLWCHGEVRLAGHFAEPAMATVDRRLRQMSDGALTRQLWVVRASLATLSRSEGRTTRMAARPVRPGADIGAGAGVDAAPDRDDGFVAVARMIGDHLDSIALRDETEAAWVGLVAPPGEGYWSLLPLGLDLYDGHPGVLLFLAHLGALTSERRYTALAEAALATLRRMIDRGRSTFRTIGYTNGWGGIIYTLVHLSAIWDRPDLLSEADELTGLLPALIDQDEHFDLTRGSAGCIGSLLSLHRRAPSARVVEAAVRCGDRLLSRARSMGCGIAWDSRIPSHGPLTGFAHGSAGIAWALGELADLTGEGRFRAAEREAVAYERSLFSAAAKNWPDLRDLDALGVTAGLERDTREARCMAAWCHGAAGIGLARLLSLGRLDEPETRAEIEAALGTTLALGFGDNHSLCHGDLGNVELLVLAGARLAEPRWGDEAARRASATLEGLRRDGWICGVPSGVETPGLMTGLAGIGYGLLRLAAPRRVPSVLALEAPTAPAG